MKRKVYSETDIPDELMDLAAYHIAYGEVRSTDFESVQRLVARGMWLERWQQQLREESAPPAPYSAELH